MIHIAIHWLHVWKIRVQVYFWLIVGFTIFAGGPFAPITRVRVGTFCKKNISEGESERAECVSQKARNAFN